MKLTFAEKWYFFWGLCYVVNLNPKSKEIHRLIEKHENCNLDLMKRKRYVSHKKAMKLITNEGFNGCRWCWQEEDLG